MKKMLCLLLVLGFACVNAHAQGEEQKSSSGMFGLTLAFTGSKPLAGLAYATATWKAALDLGFDLISPDQGDATHTITIAPGFSYDIGKSLLPYGIGVTGGVKIVKDADNLDWWVTPNFYTKAWLVDKVSFGAAIGPRIGMNANKDLTVGLGTSGGLTFYFM